MDKNCSMPHLPHVFSVLCQNSTPTLLCGRCSSMWLSDSSSSNSTKWTHSTQFRNYIVLYIRSIYADSNAGHIVTITAWLHTMAHMAKSELARQEVTNRQNWIRPWVDSKLSIKSRLDKVNSAWGLQRFGYISYVWNPYYGYVAKQTIYEYYIHTVCAVWTCTWSSRFEYLFVGKNVWVDRTRKCCHSSFGRSISSITTIWLYNIYHKRTIDSRYITISININYILINIIQFIWIETKKNTFEWSGYAFAYAREI